jgi:cytochrome-b5 reductase
LVPILGYFKKMKNHYKKWLISLGFTTFGGFHLMENRKKEKGLSRSNSNFSDLKVLDKRKITPTTFKITLENPFPITLENNYCPWSIKINHPLIQTQRYFTPVSSPSESKIDIVFKTYPYPSAEVARFLSNVSTGDSIQVHGPHQDELKNGYNFSPNKFKHVGMIAGGTGILPMYQIIKQIVQDPSDNSEVTLVYGSNSENEIILKEELECIRDQFKHKNSIKLHYIVGRNINEYDIKNAINNDNFVFICGPKSMINEIYGRPGKDYKHLFIGKLHSLGFNENMVFQFDY